MALVADGIQGVDSAPTSMAKGCKNNSLRLTNRDHKKPALDTALSFQNLVQDLKNSGFDEANIYRLVRAASLPHPALIFTPRPVCKLNEAATKLQKVYRSYRTRRNLADCAVVVEELWWKALDFATLNRSSVSFFDVKKPETAVSRWARARTKAAKVGKGLSKDENAQKLALQHWLEAIDPRHRYGHNLHLYYDVWSKSESAQPFFYWLDVGDGKEVNLDKCPRLELHCQCIKYLGPKERISFEVVIEDGKLVYKESGKLVDTSEDTKWIFVLSTIRTLYVGQKQKGLFQHSSFLAGGAITAAGRLIAREGVLEAIWPYSGHYHPTEENFKEFLSFLGEHNIDLANVKMRAADDDCPPSTHNDYEIDTGNTKSYKKSEESSRAWALDGSDNGNDGSMSEHDHPTSRDKTGYRVAKRMSRKWSTGAGPRIGCVRDYPPLLQFEALKQLNLSPKTTTCNGVPASSSSNYDPIPSPRPSPKLRLSPSIRIRYMGVWDSLPLAAQRSPVPNLPENFM